MLTAIAAVTFGLLGCEKDPQNDGTKPGGDPSKPSTEYTENLTETYCMTIFSNGRNHQN